MATALLGTTAAWADQTFSGMVTIVDRTTNEIVVGQATSGTVGSTAQPAPERFKLREAVPESLHAGDKVTVTYTESAGIKTATKVSEDKN
ncbi:hypothetical protein RPMA_14630 [Tardiphaga alba]|uniref:DUF5666 domain-containing protein n=1 Tax=Tardiphaga alba TaxID=340268 RepID=A0ABX8AC78_9BRAD|nr:hypothetical protein [Tardiphaga alba]QUS39930.1 hypothetical protein RPMA_14630 [Tardiphaga alba]